MVTNVFVLIGCILFFISKYIHCYETIIAGRFVTGFYLFIYSIIKYNYFSKSKILVFTSAIIDFHLRVVDVYRGGVGMVATNDVHETTFKIMMITIYAQSGARIVVKIIYNAYRVGAGFARSPERRGHHCGARLRGWRYRLLHNYIFNEILYYRAP